MSINAQMKHELRPFVPMFASVVACSVLGPAYGPFFGPSLEPAFEPVSSRNRRAQGIADQVAQRGVPRALTYAIELAESFDANDGLAHRLTMYFRVALTTVPPEIMPLPECV